jgi:hypothetical protein
MGHLIKLSDDRSKLVTATDPDGFTSRAYLESILVDSLKSSRELGYGGSALDVTAQNLVQLMLRLELCFEDTTRSHGVGKLLIPTILDVGHVVCEALSISCTVICITHMSNGIRHLLWDLGLFLELSKVYTSGIIMLLCAACLTILNIILFYLS